MKQVMELFNTPLLMEASRLDGFIQGQRALNALPDVKRVRSFCALGESMSLGTSGYQVSSGGVAVIPVLGPIFKGYGAYGYADQTEIKNAVQAAVQDSSVNGILLLIDSPGGSVSGTMDAANAIREADAVKPVVAYIEDCGCSAAYWLAASAREIYSNDSAITGSIGVVSALVDISKMAENLGVKVIPLVTGEMKAVGMPGTPVTQPQIDYMQNLINSMFADFVGAVSKGRGMRAETIRKMEAKVFYGADAQENKLTDGISSPDGVMRRVSSLAKTAAINKRAKAMQALAELEGVAMTPNEIRSLEKI